MEALPNAEVEEVFAVLPLLPLLQSTLPAIQDAFGILIASQNNASSHQKLTAERMSKPYALLPVQYPCKFQLH